MQTPKNTFIDRETQQEKHKNSLKSYLQKKYIAGALALVLL